MKKLLFALPLLVLLYSVNGQPGIVKIKNENKSWRLMLNGQPFFVKGVVGNSYLEKVKELALSWQQVIEMSSSDLCSIGAHSITHPVFNLLNDEGLQSEILDGKKIIEKRIGKEVNHFAYPFGTNDEIGQREYDFIKSIGFDTVAMASGGKILHNKNYDFNSLPRLSLTKDFLT